MIGVFCGGPYSNHGFPYSIEDAIEIAEARMVTAYTRAEAGELLKVRSGARIVAGDLAAAVYESDPEMTRLHGWTVVEKPDPFQWPGVRSVTEARIKVAMFTFDRVRTAGLVAR